VKTIAEVLQLSSKFLADRSVENPKRLAEDLLGWVLKLKRMDLYLQFDKPVEEAELAAMREPLKRCAKGEPVDYIIGEVSFAGCQIFVDNRVLIPRPETEILVEKVKKSAKEGVIWDLCTGSGCIGISLKKALGFPVVLVDCSSDALAVAKKNAEANGVDVELVQGDFLTPMAGRMADVVVCNPPYIATKEILNLSSSVRDYEPNLALDGGESGSVFYERLAADLPKHLNPGAQVFLEIGTDQGELVKEIFKNGPWAKMLLEKDWAGHDRFFFLEKQ
jgi:release factor glutamine methyltransferase